MGTRGGAEKPERIRLKVLYDFEYETRGQQVIIKKDEKLLLIKKTNVDWWQVIRPSEVDNSFVIEKNTFYVPAGYVTEVRESLPNTTRFYIDKEKMFNYSEKNNANEQSPEQTKNLQESVSEKNEHRKGHDSFRSVIRKFSGSSNSSNDSNKPVKPTKSSKIIKVLKKSSTDNSEDKLSSSSSKNKAESSETSAFGMCFGRDMKNAETRLQNPFQEELEHAVNNRSKKNVILDTKLGLNKTADHKLEIESSKPVNKVQDRWEKSIALALKNSEEFQTVSSRIIENYEEKNRQLLLPGKFKKEEPQKDEQINSKQLKKCNTPESEENLCKQIKEIKEKPTEFVKVEPSINESFENKKSDSDSKIDTVSGNENLINNEVREAEDLSKDDIDKFLLNDKRKMWAIETLMSELMQSSGKDKFKKSNNNENLDFGTIDSACFENAEIQVDLLPQDQDITKEYKNEKNQKIESSSKKYFDFSSCANNNLIKSTTSCKSPKHFDEYNEANILNDTEKSKKKLDIMDYSETPSYSNISLRLKRGKVPSKLKMPTRDFREELQLTPSLEKLANQIQFLPASKKPNKQQKENISRDMDGIIASLSHDSLRLYKRHSKSDGALNKQELGRLKLQPFDRRRQIQSLDIEEQSERKYTQKQARIPRREKLSSIGRSDRTAITRYRLNRKSRSLGDLDCPDTSDVENDSNQTNSKKRYRPVPKLRSKESLRRVKLSSPSPPPVSPTRQLENQAAKPVPAKRRIFISPPALTKNENLNECNKFREVDIKHSTAVDFKTLLCTSDSGSEEFLQYKTFPTKASSNKEFERGIFCSDGNVNLSGKATNMMGNSSNSTTDSVDYVFKSSNLLADSANGTSYASLSDETVLKSANSSLGAGLSNLDDTWTTCSSPTLDDESTENLNLPPGWIQTFDPNAKRICYINNRGDKWFSSSDYEGKIYFFEENSNESSWALPSVTLDHRARTYSNDWPELFDGNMYIIKEGPINKTKITAENGKKLRKNWTTSYVVLTELYLLFFKDAKTFAAMKMDQSATAKPEISVDLNGASIEPAERLSHRKNVYLVSSVLGLQVLIQWDNAAVTAEWYQEIHNVILKLPSCQDNRNIE